ncbi:unnamed protein product [Cunninghamella echinulata]
MTIEKKNPYHVLGVDCFASNKEIKKRYLQLYINWAYEQLTKQKHKIQRVQQSPFGQQQYQQYTPINTKVYTRNSLLAGLGIMVAVVVYLKYEPKEDPTLFYKDHSPSTPPPPLSNIRSWRRNN